MLCTWAFSTEHKAKKKVFLVLKLGQTAPSVIQDKNTNYEWIIIVLELQNKVNPPVCVKIEVEMK